MLKRICFAAAFSIAVASIGARSVFSQNTSYYLPHITHGDYGSGSFETTFILLNNTYSSVSVTLRLTDVDNKVDGNPIPVSIPGLGTNTVFSFTLAPGTTRFLPTGGLGILVSRAAVVTTSTPIGVSAIITDYNRNGGVAEFAETGVRDTSVLSRFTFPVDIARDFNIGIAFYNPSISAVTLTLRLLDADGAVAGITEQTLPPGSHTARYASELFPGTGAFRGSVAVTGTDAVAALVVRQNKTPGTQSYTTLPITPGISQDIIPVTNNGQNPTQVSGLTGIVAVTANAVLKSDGTIWALNPTYADRTTLISMSPTQVLGLSGVKAISGGMALRNDGTVWSFGGSQPVQVSGLRDVAEIHQCCGGVMALKRDGTVWAWWSPGIPGPFEVAEVRGTVAVAERAFGGLALMSDGTVWMFGLMGEGDSYLSYLGQVPGPGGFVAIDAEYSSALGLKSDGTVWDLDSRASIQVQGITGAVAISAGSRHHLALDQNGTIWEWGHDYLGLGHMEKTTWPVPRPVVGLTEVVKIAASWNHGLALRRDGTVWVWRSN